MIIGREYEKTRLKANSKIRNKKFNSLENLEEGICYLCKGKIQQGFLVEYSEKIRGLESEVKLPIHKKCFELSKNYIFFF